MAAGLPVPRAAVLCLVTLGAASALPWLAQADGSAMYLGMLGIMLVRRDHYTHGGAHQQAAGRAESRPARHIPWRRLFLVTAYLGAILLGPPILGSLNFGYKTFGAIEPYQAPAYSGALPALPTPDPSKKIAVVLSGPGGSEIGDTITTPLWHGPSRTSCSIPLPHRTFQMRTGRFARCSPSWRSCCS
jgi:hypothetical protein